MEKPLKKLPSFDLTYSGVNNPTFSNVPSGLGNFDTDIPDLNTYSGYSNESLTEGANNGSSFVQDIFNTVEDIGNAVDFSALGDLFGGGNDVTSQTYIEVDETDKEDKDKTQTIYYILAGFGVLIVGYLIYRLATKKKAK